MSSSGVIGIDPALGRSGWALLVNREHPTLLASGVVETGSDPRGRQLMVIHDGFAAILRHHLPSAVYVEQPGQRIGQETTRSSVEALAMSRGCIVMAATREGLAVEEVDFHEVRRSLLGRWKAGKRDVVDLLRVLDLLTFLDNDKGPDLDVADATLLALYGLLSTGAITSHADRVRTQAQAPQSDDRSCWQADARRAAPRRKP